MSDWVIYTDDIRKAMADLASVNEERVTEDGQYIAKLGPVGLIMDGVKAMALMGSDTKESDIELNAVVAKGNIQIIGIFDNGVFSPAFAGASEVFRSMRPSQMTGELGGRQVTIDLPDQFTAFT